MQWDFGSAAITVTFDSVANSYRRSPGRPRLPVLGLGDLLPEAGSTGGRPKKSHISASISPTDFYNQSICSGIGRISTFKP